MTKPAPHPVAARARERPRRRRSPGALFGSAGDDAGDEREQRLSQHDESREIAGEQDRKRPATAGASVTVRAVPAAPAHDPRAGRALGVAPQISVSIQRADGTAVRTPCELRSRARPREGRLVRGDALTLEHPVPPRLRALLRWANHPGKPRSPRGRRPRRPRRHGDRAHAVPHLPSADLSSVDVKRVLRPEDGR